MRIVSVSDAGIADAVRAMRSGFIVAHATETCYGLACDLTNSKAVKKLFELKGRPDGMPVSALFPSVEVAQQWVEWNEDAEALAQAHLPGALTMILPARLPKNGINLPWKTIGVRISSHPVAQRLAEQAGVPLSTTSANLHGRQEAYSVENLELQPDLVLDSGVLPLAKPSTVVILEDGKMQIVRQGSVQL